MNEADLLQILNKRKMQKYDALCLEPVQTIPRRSRHYASGCI
ncbi:hypothetical protein [Candidatus Nitrosoglobus terrae]|nr:hypothetical protein [Candidatus Nitrosoglobus terrae]